MVCLTCFRGGSDRPRGRFRGGATSDELASFGLKGVAEGEEEAEELLLLWTSLLLLLLLLLLDLLDRAKAATGPPCRRVEDANRHAEQRRSDMVRPLYGGRRYCASWILLEVPEVVNIAGPFFAMRSQTRSSCGSGTSLSHSLSRTPTTIDIHPT
jgi:hypothetical protein